MKIVRKSPFSGIVNEREIAVTQAQLNDWESGSLIQDAMPNLTPGQREFIMTGITEKEWDDLFPDKDE